MTSTDITRHDGNTVAVADDHYLDRIPQLAQQLARSGMCPESFKGKPDDIAIVGYSLADNGIRLSINTLPQCYVVHGRPGYMAQIQTAMAALHGIVIHPVGHKCDEGSATVEVVMPSGQRHEVTFTMAEADRAGLTKPSKTGAASMYKLWPTNMLVARATTRAISWYCPAVKLGLAGTIDMDEIGVIDAGSHDSSPDETGEVIPIPAAKKRILDMVLAHWPDSDDETDEQKLAHAKQSANLLWLSHRLPSGQDTIPVSRLRGILTTYDEIDARAAAQADQQTEEPAAAGPEVVTPEIVDSAPADVPADSAEAQQTFAGYQGPDGEPF